ncbi:MAG: hypothetical protein LBB58_01430 [Cellulomonadaceae bacterium]|jgi:heat shock protein HslJ|nr:hypothetical protein [Cellulomonadaceae bacterium]
MGIRKWLRVVAVAAVVAAVFSSCGTPTGSASAGSIGSPGSSGSVGSTGSAGGISVGGITVGGPARPGSQNPSALLRAGSYSGRLVAADEVVDDFAMARLNHPDPETSLAGGNTDTVISIVANPGCNSVSVRLSGGIIPEHGMGMTEVACRGETGAVRMANDIKLRSNLEPTINVVNNETFVLGNVTFTWHPEPEKEPVPDAPKDGSYSGAIVTTSDGVTNIKFLGTATVSANGTQLSFYADCNQIGAPLIDGHLGPIRSTRMFCENDELEQILIENLNRGPFQMLSATEFQIGDINYRRALPPEE